MYAGSSLFPFLLRIYFISSGKGLKLVQQIFPLHFFVSGLFFPPRFTLESVQARFKLVQLSPGQLEILISVISSVSTTQ